MHYDPRHEPHGLPHDPFYSLVVPRPIGWITTVSEAGIVNLAPYSFFNAVSSDPPIVMFSSSGRKDSLVEAMAKSAARTVGSTVGREIVRGVLGSLLGSGRRR